MYCITPLLTNVPPHGCQYFRKKKKKHQLDRDVARIEAIQNFLVQEPTKLTRTVSNPKINIQAEGPFRVST